MLKGKEVTGASQAQHLASKWKHQLCSPYFTLTSEHTKYCAICTPLGKMCPNEYSMSLDWDEDLEEDKRKNQEIKDQKSNGDSPNQLQILISYYFYSSASISSIEQLYERSSVTPEKEDQKCNTLMTL